MARNKYPEETERKILEVSRRLFAEKGYEHTTIHDIVNALGMSKGAVYHHFKSKEDIYDRITDEYYGQQAWFQDIRQLPGDTGLEKMRNMLRFLLSDPEKLQLDQLAGPSRTMEPRLLELGLRSTMNDAAPVVATLIEMGNADGSTHVLQPKETAEVFMLMMNMWLGLFSTTREDFTAKLYFTKTFLDGMGLPILNDQLLATFGGYYEGVMSHLTPS